MCRAWVLALVSDPGYRGSEGALQSKGGPRRAADKSAKLLAAAV